jgi:hypothetical protein
MGTYKKKALKTNEHRKDGLTNFNLQADPVETVQRLIHRESGVRNFYCP